MFVKKPIVRYVRTPEDQYNERMQTWFFKVYAIFLLSFFLLMFVASKVSHVPEVQKEATATIQMTTIVANREIKYVPTVKHVTKAKTVHASDINVGTKKVAWVIIVKQDDSYDVYALANAVAMAETGNCRYWYGKTYNNCFWIKNGRTAPCPKIGKSKMCIYEKPQDSYEAFVKIWSSHYKRMPTLKMAEAWTWKDAARTWLKNVWHHYKR